MTASDETVPSPAPPAVPPTVATSSGPGPAKKKEEGPRLIFEQILVALILAFVFRAFVVEAFVIPTGSMATTLMGAHMRFDCPDCGWRYTVNYGTDGGQAAVPDRARVRTPAGLADRVYALHCPNCGFRLPRDNPLSPDDAAGAPPVRHGDRILVLKHHYLLKDPSRWDVVVFKNPSRGARAGEIDPDSTEPYQQNFIKRLIGLPGEDLMLLDGHVYASTANKPRSELLPTDFSIRRRDEAAMSASWRVVYHDDFRPQGIERVYANAAGRRFADPAFVQPWRPAGGWRENDPRVGGFGFDGEAGVLRFDPTGTGNEVSRPLTDFLTYNVTLDRDQMLGTAAADSLDLDWMDVYDRFRFNTVSDLRLEFFYERRGGDGPLTVVLTKRQDRFEAEIDAGRTRLVRYTPEGSRLVIAEGPGVGHGRHHVDFSNADYRVRLRIDGRTVLETTDADYAPDVPAILDDETANRREPLPTVEIHAAGHRAELRHVALWRGVYYTARMQLSGRFYPFASPTRFPDHVVRLGDDEYFTVGDNPFLSGDARAWGDPLRLRYERLDVEAGRVPGRFLLGKAFFVYWPSGARPVPFLPAIVPDVGEMRMIR